MNGTLKLLIIIITIFTDHKVKNSFVLRGMLKSLWVQSWLNGQKTLTSAHVREGQTPLALGGTWSISHLQPSRHSFHSVCPIQCPTKTLRTDTLNQTQNLWSSKLNLAEIQARHYTQEKPHSNELFREGNELKDRNDCRVFQQHSALNSNHSMATAISNSRARVCISGDEPSEGSHEAKDGIYNWEGESGHVCLPPAVSQRQLPIEMDSSYDTFI